MSVTRLKSMTYGTLPTFEEFETHFDEILGVDGYRITLGRTDSAAVEGFKLGDGEWQAQELYDACKEIVEYVEKDYPADEDSPRDETAMSLVSSIMETLLFEWV